MMKRSTIPLSAENFGRVAIDIGRVAENQAVQVRVDLSKFLLQEPKATASLTVESPSGERYPAITRMEGQALIWDVAAADVASAGMGKVQMNVLGPDGETLKSAVAVTRISASIVGDGQAPEPVQNWLDSAQKAVNEANKAAEAAQDAAAEVKEKLDAGELVGPQGPQGPKGPPGEVEDVKIGDSILVANGAAILPNVLVLSHDGTVRAYLAPDSTKWTGNIGIAQNGNLILATTTQAIVNNRNAGSQQFISAGILDYAVKAALCDGKGEAWTVEEKKAALARLGLSLADDGAIKWEG